MAKRIKLHIDTINHINDLTFKVYRSLDPEVNEDDLWLMNVRQGQAVKERLLQTGEVLKRDDDTPYAFHTKRHYETDVVAPTVQLGDEPVHLSDLLFFSDDRMIEIHSGDIGLFDGRTIYMDYEYLSIPIWDDYNTESGKAYAGPPATGLRVPLAFNILQNIRSHKLLLTYDIDREPIHYYYRIVAVDDNGNKTEWSDMRVEALTPSDIYIRIQKSPDGERWEEVAITNNEAWLDDILCVDLPTNVQNAEVLPFSSKETEIRFDNPMYDYVNRPRTSYIYRLRAEDDQGEYTDWIYLGPLEVYLKPKQVIIRRKLDNGSVSSKDQTDAITVFTLKATDLDPRTPKIRLVDDQLNDANIYSYTFFYEDEMGKEAEPFFLISDQTPWKNIILFSGEIKQELIESDFIMTFELADHLIEIGTEEGTG